MREEFEKAFPVPDGVYWHITCEWYEASSPEYFPDSDFYNDMWKAWQAATALQAEEIERLTQCLAKANGQAEHFERVRDIEAKYRELLYQISIKHPAETLHETALRYLRQAENQNNPPEQALSATAREVGE